MKLISKIIISILLFMMITACTYPIYKTLQPKSMVVVLDENKMAVKNAKVHLQTTECMPCKDSERVALSNNEGIVSFNSQREWRKEILTVHGSKFFTWGWCVEKKGYKTIVTSKSSSNKFESHRTFILKKGVSLPCDSPYLVSEFKLKRFNDTRLKSHIQTLINEMLDPNKATKAYVELEKLGKESVPYIVLQMDDFRELPVKNMIDYNNIKVTYVTDALSVILTKLTTTQISRNIVGKSLNDKIQNIYQWRNFVRHWGLSDEK